MKLRYKNNRWEDEKGVPIAPNDQEKVSRFIYDNEAKFIHGTTNVFERWIPNYHRFYNSGDLEFELKSCPHHCLETISCNSFSVCKQKFWVLKEVKTVNSIRAEMPEKLKEAYNVPSLRQLCWRIDREIWAKVEVHEATQSWGREQTGLLILDFLKEIKTEEQKQIKQLQSRIAELEKQIKEGDESYHRLEMRYESIEQSLDSIKKLNELSGSNQEAKESN